MKSTETDSKLLESGEILANVPESYSRDAEIMCTSLGDADTSQNLDGLTFSQKRTQSADASQSFILDTPFNSNMFEYRLWLLRQTRSSEILTSILRIRAQSIVQVESMVLQVSSNGPEIVEGSRYDDDIPSFYLWVKPGDVINVHDTYQVISNKENLSLDVVEGKSQLVGKNIIEFEVLRVSTKGESKQNTVSEQRKQPLVSGSSPSLKMVAERIIIFAGPFHGKSTYVDKNEWAYEVEMDFAVVEARGHFDLKEENFGELRGEAYNDATTELIESDVPIVVSHMYGQRGLDVARKSNRSIGFVKLTWDEIVERGTSYSKQATPESSVSRALAAVGYYQELWQFDIKGPFYDSVDDAVKDLGKVSGSEHSESQNVLEGEL